MGDLFETEEIASICHYERAYKSELSLAIHTGMHWLLSFDWLLAVISLSEPNGTLGDTSKYSHV